MGEHVVIKVSVLTICKNGEKYLPEYFSGFMNQSNELDYEIIFVDNGSSDNTKSIVLSMTGLNLRFFSKPNLSIPELRNFALSKCSAEYIRVLDVDDQLTENTLSKQIQHIEDTGADIVVGLHRSFPKHFLLSPFDWLRRPIYSNEFLDYINHITHSAVLYRKSSILGVGGYDKRFLYSEDYELWLRAKRKHLEFSFMDTIVCNLRLNNSSTSVVKKKEMLAFHVNAIKLHSRFNPTSNNLSFDYKHNRKKIEKLLVSWWEKRKISELNEIKLSFLDLKLLARIHPKLFLVYILLYFVPIRFFLNAKFQKD